MKYHLEKVIDVMEQRQEKEDWDVRRDAIEYMKQYKADLEKKCSNCKNWHGHGSYDPKDSWREEYYCEYETWSYPDDFCSRWEEKL